MTGRRGSVPRRILEDVGRALGLAPDRIETGSPARGGCINHGVRLDTPAGPRFLKWRPDAPPDAFHAEADGLAALSGGPLRVPEVEAVGPDWLVLKWIPEGSARSDAWRLLGRGLAEIHRAPTPTETGWRRDNYIGSLPQPNPPGRSWTEFWIGTRLAPLAARARELALLDSTESAALDAALERIPDLIGPARASDGPSLLHGDLWSGNVMFDASGDPVLIDPAVYVGHREVDLAMTGLFGGFPPAFHEGYEEAWPVLDGHEGRFEAYRLYPLLVHVLLFGRSYAPSLLAAARRIGWAGRR